jgi:hypothetical protein
MIEHSILHIEDIMDSGEIDAFCPNGALNTESAAGLSARHAHILISVI